MSPFPKAHPLYRCRHCEPTTILLITAVALSAASTAASLHGQQQQADAQAHYQQELAKSTNAAAAVQANQVRDQQAQAREATARDLSQAHVASEKAQSTATVSAGEAGVSGNSVASLLQEYRAQEGIQREAILRQQALNDVAAGQQVSAIRAGAASGNLSMNAPIGQPNYLAGALSVGAQAASSYVAANPRTPKTQTK